MSLMLGSHRQSSIRGVSHWKIDATELPLQGHSRKLRWFRKHKYCRCCPQRFRRPLYRRLERLLYTSNPKLLYRKRCATSRRRPASERRIESPDIMQPLITKPPTDSSYPPQLIIMLSTVTTPPLMVKIPFTVVISGFSTKS